MKNFVTFGQFLRDARLKCEMSQKELASAMHFQSSQIVSNWERGVQAAPISRAKKLAKILHLKTDTLKRFYVGIEKERIKTYLD